MFRFREALKRLTYVSAVLIVSCVFISAVVADETVDARHRSGFHNRHNDNKVDFRLTLLHNNDGESQLIKRERGSTTSAVSRGSRHSSVSSGRKDNDGA